ncbi:MAG TPA: hypothetical protein VJY11_00065 [Erysipelothrix sp.]|nr:hypothetical protein [Erysipelothrix sp.]
MKKEKSPILKVLLAIVYVIIFVVGLSMVVIGQRTVSYESLGIMCLGLAGLLFLVYTYNKKYNV